MDKKKMEKEKMEVGKIIYFKTFLYTQTDFAK